MDRAVQKNGWGKWEKCDRTEKIVPFKRVTSV